MNIKKFLLFSTVFYFLNFRDSKSRWQTAALFASCFRRTTKLSRHIPCLWTATTFTKNICTRNMNSSTNRTRRICKAFFTFYSIPTTIGAIRLGSLIGMTRGRPIPITVFIITCPRRLCSCSFWCWCFCLSCSCANATR